MTNLIRRILLILLDESSIHAVYLTIISLTINLVLECETARAIERRSVYGRWR